MMAVRPIAILVTALLSFIVYVVFSGSVSAYDIVSGVVVALTVSGFLSAFTLKNPLKTLNPIRWFWLIVYALYYFFIAEVRSHLDVMYRIIHPKMPVKPGIIRVPYTVETDYAVAAVANSVTNTPGTVVVDIDPEKKEYYIHWINVRSTDPEKAREIIISRFEYFAHRVFD